MRATSASGVIALITDDRLRLKAFDQGLRLLNIGNLPGSESKAQWVVQSIHHRMDLGT